MAKYKVLLIDSDDYSSAVLVEQLQALGFAAVERVAQGLAVPGSAARLQPDLIVFNHHFDRPDELLSCCTAKLTVPDAVLVAVAATGPAFRNVRQWGTETGYIDAVLQKPLAPGDLGTATAELLKTREATRALREQSERLASLLPDGALTAMQNQVRGEEELFEAAVLFTDVRRSSDLITRTAPREFFQMLNTSLSAQAACIRGFDGEVVKYTGDGLMAVFRGMGRSYLALRCALELATHQGRTPAMPFGIGVAEGLVLAGFVGPEGPGQRRQYDVIGATVHLAARLCGMARAGEVLATQRTHAASRLQAASHRTMGPVHVAGFPTAIECVAFDPGAATQAV